MNTFISYVHVCSCLSLLFIISQSLQPGLVKGRWTKVSCWFVYAIFCWCKSMSAIHINPYSCLLSTNKLQEEDDRIVEHVTKANGGDVKWSSLRLPGRIGEQIKQRWENILDPNIKKVSNLVFGLDPSSKHKSTHNWFYFIQGLSVLRGKGVWL